MNTQLFGVRITGNATIDGLCKVNKYSNFSTILNTKKSQTKSSRSDCWNRTTTPDAEADGLSSAPNGSIHDRNT